MTQGKQISRTEYVTPKTEQAIVAQTSPVTKLTKLTKTAKKQFIREALRAGVFDRDNMCKVLNTSDRNIRNYLNEIAVEDAERNPETLHVLRSICTFNLIHKASENKLSDNNQITIVLAGEPKRNENLNLTMSKTEVKVDVPELLKQYEDLFEEATLLENAAPEPIHPTSTNSKTSPVSIT